MAEENTITTIFRADISQFSASTQQLNTYIKTVNSEFNVATASMGKWSDSTDGLQAKITQLNKTLEAEKMKLGNLESALADLQKEGKGNTQQAQKLQIAINNQRAVVQKTEKAIEGYENSLNELEEAGVDSKEALEELNRESEELKQNAQELGGGILKGVAVGIAGIATACIGAFKGLSNLVESTAELRLEQGRVQTAFEQSGFSAQFALKHMDDFYAVLGDTKKTTETLQQLAMFAKTEQEVIDYTNILTGVYARLGDALPTESLSEAINHTIKLGEVQGSMADALEWAGVTTDDFNKKLAKCNNEQERSALINKTLTELYGEASKQYQETNKDVIEATKAQGEYNNKMADIARKVQPAMTQFKVIMADALTQVMNKFSEADIEGFLTNIADLVSKLVNEVLPPMMNILSWLLDNMNWLAPAIGSVVAGILAGTLAYKGITTAMNLAKIAQLGLNAAMAANPIGLVATAIGVLVTAITLLWNKSEGFRKFFTDMWETFKGTLGNFADFFKNIFTGNILGAMKSLANGIISAFEMALNFVIGVINGVTQGISYLWTWAGIPAIPKIPNVNIPRLAEGGVIDKPTLAMVGEAGKEAVVPLENNTQWINKLADTLSNKLGNQQVINNNYTIENKFEKMETSRLALHKSNLELKKLMGG